MNADRVRIITTRPNHKINQAVIAFHHDFQVANGSCVLLSIGVIVAADVLRANCLADENNILRIAI